jgi:hypothetical protein
MLRNSETDLQIVLTELAAEMTDFERRVSETASAMRDVRAEIRDCEADLWCLTDPYIEARPQ